MIIKPNKIVAVLNDFDMAIAVLTKAFHFATEHGAVVEVIYVHEKPLFELPDYFLCDEKIAEGTLDKERVRAEIRKRIDSLDYDEECALFTYIDDTADRVAHLVKEDKDVLIVTAYHPSITKSLLTKLSQAILVLKGSQDTYHDIALSINVNSHSMTCITSVEAFFNKSNLHLLYDYRYVVDPSMELDLQNLALIEESQKNTFEALKKESRLDGKFFVDGSFLGDELVTYINKKDFALVIVCSNTDDFFVSDTLALNLLEDDGITSDIFIAMKQEK